MTIDYADDVQIGGSQAGAINIISGNTRGIQPDYSNNVKIQGNYTGTDYTGTNARPNLRNGISFGLGTHDSIVGGSTIADGNIIANNVGNGVETWTNATRTEQIMIENNTVTNNTQNGISIGQSDDTTVIGNTVTNNTQHGIYLSQSNQATINNNQSTDNIGTGIAITSGSSNISVFSNQVHGNGSLGVQVFGGTNVSIGEANKGNTIFDNVRANIQVMGASPFGMVTSNIRIQSNAVGKSGVLNGAGMVIEGDSNEVTVGGTTDNLKNTVFNAQGIGIGIGQMTSVAMSLTLTPFNISVLGNSVYNTSDQSPFGSSFSSDGLGIEVL